VVNAPIATMKTVVAVHGVTASINQVPNERNRAMKPLTYTRVFIWSLFTGTVFAFALWEWVPYLVFAVVMLSGLVGTLAFRLHQANMHALSLQSKIKRQLSQSQSNQARRRLTAPSWRGVSDRRHDLRIGDHERDECLRELADHYAAGRLKADEHGRRQDLALAAEYGTDLRKILMDLPISNRDGWYDV
jgi:hypothetical protein